MRKTMSIALDVFLALHKVMVRISEALVSVCGVLLFIFMFIVIADVTGRYLFIKPVPGTLEMGESLLVFVIFLGLTNVLIRGGHLRATLVIDRFPPGWRDWLNIFALALGFILMLLIAWQSLPFAIDSYEQKEAGICFPLPVYPAKFAYFAGSTLFCLQFFIQFINQLFAKLVDRAAISGEKS